jgi:RNA polymerase sigma factor (sigma-70 family)
MNHLNLEEIVESIRKEDRKVLLYLYRSYYPSVKKFILNNSGSSEDAEDIFQDALLLIYLKIKENNLTLCCNLSTFIFSVSKFLWLKTLSKRKINVKITLLDEIIDADCNFHEDYIWMEKRKLIMEAIREMSPDCQKIMNLYLENTPEERIVAIMGYSSIQYARNRRTSCKDRLVKKLWNSQIYKELTNAENRKDNKIPRW